MNGSKVGSNKWEHVACALGSFSIGLGLAEIFWPGGLGKAIGVRENQTLIRILGLREIASGLGIVSKRKPATWMWSRVGGDAIDLTLLGAALVGQRSFHGRLAAAAGAVAGITAVDLLCSRELSRNGKAGNKQEAGVRAIRKAITINRSAEDLYKFWRKFENLPQFMAHLESVREDGPARSHWIAKAPTGKRVEWDAEITADVPNESISWRSLSGDVTHSGSVQFRPAFGRRGTVVTVELKYQPPGGLLGTAIAKVFGEEPAQQIADDLRFFKQFMETGVIATTKGQPAARASGVSKKFDRETPRSEMAPTAQGF
jgi:uncharacterized membrane protein